MELESEMERVIVVAGVVAIAFGGWLLIGFPRRHRHSISLGIVLVVIGVYLVLSGYWSGAIIGPGPAMPTAVPGTS